MDNINHLQSELQNSVGVDNLEKIQQFLVVFSRFEFALLEQGLVHNHIFANWHEFARLVETSFNQNSSDELKNACTYIRVFPPNKHNGTVWESLELSHSLTICETLIRYIQTIRNNLFHGKKVQFDIVRDKQLIESALIILDYCISISPENIKTAFWFGLTPPEV
jgi:hypothetical protein